VSSGRGLIAALALLLVAPATIAAPRDAPGKPDARLQTLGEEFVARRLARAPHAATRGGVHAGQPMAHAVTALTLAEELAWLHAFRERLAAVPREPTSERVLLETALDRELLELDVLRPFQRDPGAYVALVAASVEAALDRSSGSPCARVERAVRRLSEVPEVLRAARLNLKDPPRVLTELAIERLAQVLRFYREDVPRLGAGCRGAPMQADLAQADTTAVRAVEGFLRYLEEDLLPVSRGELAIGPEACRRLLRSALGAEVAPVETLLAQGARIIDARRAELEALAPQGAAGGVRAALQALRSGPSEDGDAAAQVTRAVERVEAFLREQRVVSIPARLALTVREAPAFRAGPGPTLADPGGRVGPRPSPAWLEVTRLGSLDSLAGGDAGAEAAPGRLNRWETDLAVAHEGLPGRFLRSVALRGAPRLRRLLQETWPAEDWGEYGERMLLDQGYGGEDPRYRLAGAARALRQAGRTLACLALHSGAMSEDEARRMLEDRCLLDPAEADREARSAAADPAIMGYTFGAQRLRELQEEARRRLGPRFQARAFHDAVLRCGASPPGIVIDRLWLELADAAGDPALGARP
jgi:uncharacterized protein DUF885